MVLQVWSEPVDFCMDDRISAPAVNSSLEVHNGRLLGWIQVPTVNIAAALAMRGTIGLMESRGAEEIVLDLKGTEAIGDREACVAIASMFLEGMGSFPSEPV